MSNREWLSDQLESLEFQRLVEREDFIERYLDAIEVLMDEKGVSRSDLARRMDCSRANITQLFRRAKNLAAESMVDLAFHLGYRIRCRLEPLNRVQLSEAWPAEKHSRKWAHPKVAVTVWEQRLDPPFCPDREHLTSVMAADNTDYALAS